MLKKSEPQSLETYLARIERELRALPAQARADELREIEAHLRAMIEARGDVAAVLAQFGEPRKVGRDLRRAWERKQPEAWWHAGFALLAGLSIWLLSRFVLKEFTTFYLASHNVDINVLGHTTTDYRIGSVILTMIYYQISIAYSIFFIIGYASSTISPKRGIIAALPFLAIRIFSEVIYDFSDSHSSLLGLMLRATLCFLLTASGCHFGARFSRKRAIAKIS